MVFETLAGETHYHVPLLLARSASRRTAARKSTAEVLRCLRLGLEAPAELNKMLKLANQKFARVSRRCDRPTAGPHVHRSGATVHGRCGAARGTEAIDTLHTHAATAQAFAKVIGLPADYPGLAETVRARVVDKLEREPVEDFRLDFEDGYGTRPDDEEDGHAASAARRSRPASAGNAAAVPRHPHQADVTRAARAQPAHARHFRDDAGQDRESGCPTTSRSRSAR